MDLWRLREKRKILNRNLAEDSCFPEVFYALFPVRKLPLAVPTSAIGTHQWCRAQGASVALGEVCSWHPRSDLAFVHGNIDAHDG